MWARLVVSLNLQRSRYRRKQQPNPEHGQRALVRQAFPGPRDTVESLTRLTNWVDTRRGVPDIPGYGERETGAIADLKDDPAESSEFASPSGPGIGRSARA